MECPNCGESMSLNHGFCSSCKKYCGCSFNATSDSDFCDTHRPKVGTEAKREVILKKLKPLVDNFIKHNPEGKEQNEDILYESFCRFLATIEHDPNPTVFDLPDPNPQIL